MNFSKLRQTRSGTIYAAYTGVNSDFAFEEALFESIVRDREEDYADPFVNPTVPGSPTVTSPASTLPSSSSISPSFSVTASGPPELNSTACSPSSSSPSPSFSVTAPAPRAPRNSTACSASSPFSKDLLQRKQQKQKEKSKMRRQQQRLANKMSLTNATPVAGNLFTKIARKSATVAAPIALEACEVAKSGFVGRKAAFTPRVFLLKQLVGPSSLNFRLVRWDGISPMHIFDRSRRAIVILAGQPRDSGWLEVLSQATSAMNDARLRGNFSTQAIDHSRGRFPTLARGFAHGGGRTEPSSQRPRDSVNAGLVDGLLSVFQRIASFQSQEVLYAWQPRLHQYFSKMIQTFTSQQPGLEQNWPRSVFSSAVWNLGPQTACYKHVDFANVPFGLCAITALGSFNPITSGHIVLWRLNLVIEFPPGATALIPSAVIPHGNTPLQSDETRFSFTQYCSGGLFRWMEHGMQSDRTYFESLSDDDILANREKDARRWELGLSLLTTEKELEEKMK
ncbi:hypothetical protein H0H93_005327 [Arthromyces matolae]|nr:hypothetical protein H0H93_005327 [Arthromyces matolae]